MKILKLLLLLTLLIIANCAPRGESSPASVGPELPSKIRTLLIKEMNAIHDATKDILDALVRGQDKIVASKAQAIHESFIMKKEMTPSDKEQLINSVPKEFIEKDRAFHKLSANLSNAAKKGNKTLQMEIFTEMVNACVNCHSHHATHRFPEFTEEE